MKKLHFNIIILIDNYERFIFFDNILKSSGLSKEKIVLLHSNLYTYIWCKFNRKDMKSHLLSSQSGNVADGLSIEEVKNEKIYNTKLSDKSLSFLMNAMNPKSEIWVFSGFQYAFRRIHSYLDMDKCIFYEIGNFPNKYQCSKTGINSSSTHNSKVSELRGTVVVDQIQVNSLRESLFSFIPPQANKKIRNRIGEFLVNKLGYIAFNTLAPHASFYRQVRTAISMLQSKRLFNKFKSNDIFNSISDHYLLFIGQVEEDTQTIFQSCETGISALKKANRLANKMNLQLIVRLHPAEKKIDAMNKMDCYCQHNNIIICNYGSLSQAVEKSTHVVTINSTGGLQALLLGKAVTCLGDSFYSDWSKEDVFIYHENVLKDLC
jgi:hypothetical protein